MIENRRGFDIFCHAVLIVGVLLVVFVTLAPNGIMGWVDAWRRSRAHKP